MTSEPLPPELLQIERLFDQTAAACETANSYAIMVASTTTGETVDGRPAHTVQMRANVRPDNSDAPPFLRAMYALLATAKDADLQRQVLAFAQAPKIVRDRLLASLDFMTTHTEQLAQPDTDVLAGRNSSDLMQRLRLIVRAQCADDPCSRLVAEVLLKVAEERIDQASWTVTVADVFALVVRCGNAAALATCLGSDVTDEMYLRVHSNLRMMNACDGQNIIFTSKAIK